MGFLETLFSFHPNKNHEKQKITIGEAYNQPTFCLNGEPVSIRKSLIGLQAEYLKKIKDYS